MSPYPRRRQLRRALTTAVVAATIFVVVLIVLIATDVLVLPAAKTPAPVTIASVHLEVLVGSSNGIPWFVPTSVNYTGYPIQVAPGGSWTVVWQFSPTDNSTVHTIYSVTPTATPSANLAKPSTSPALPWAVSPTEDEASLQITVVTPATPGVSLSVVLTVVAQTPG